MTKDPELKDRIQVQRQDWKPVIRWMAKVAVERLKKGRQVLIENPKGSELWNFWDMLKLLGSEHAFDSSTLELLEKMNIDLCAWPQGSSDQHAASEAHFDCNKLSYTHGRLRRPWTMPWTTSQDLPLEGGSPCRHAQSWTDEFCEEVICAHLCDLDHLLVQTAFPAEAQLEDCDGENDPEADDAVYDEDDLATGRAQGRLLDERNSEDEEMEAPDAELGGSAVEGSQGTVEATLQAGDSDCHTGCAP